VVEGDADSDLPSPGVLPVAVLWRGPTLGAPGPPAADAVVGEPDLDRAIERIGAAPRCAAAIAVLLRGQPERAVEHGLAAESAVYSVVQSGPEFESWRSRHPARAAQPETSVVVVERHDGSLTITLDRPQRGNAINAQLRDELCSALAVAVVDGSIERIVLRGNGPHFSTGGDLDEFGTRADPASAHVTRLARSPARLIHRLADRTEARIHGVTLGGGIELAAFAGTVIAAPGSHVGLPEIELGLIPGAGGTVSITQRIGRQRTAAMALTGALIDAETALGWRLVDRIETGNGPGGDVLAGT
jgi:enoyl-CoA hydratase/carnithine racemase